MTEPTKRSEILKVVEVDGAIYFLSIDYEESGIADAIGHVHKTDGSREEGEVPVQVLATNDTLRAMWASPQGSLWVASANGSVGTTAQVRWPLPTSGADYKTMGSSPPWQVTDLPRVKASGLRPNVTALWGTSDSDVYAGAYGGHIYRWDGSLWTQSFEGPGEGRGTIRAFGGAAKDVWAVGKQATILHFDGRAWRRVAVPGPPNGSELFTGVLLMPAGDVLISGSGDEGRLLNGSAAGGLAEFGRFQIELIDMAALGERILFCSGDGVAELLGRRVEMIKSTFSTQTMSAGDGRLFFIEPEQEYPGFVEYDPRQGDDAWWRMEF